jgi:hypothetical protein
LLLGEVRVLGTESVVSEYSFSVDLRGENQDRFSALSRGFFSLFLDLRNPMSTDVRECIQDMFDELLMVFVVIEQL